MHRLVLWGPQHRHTSHRRSHPERWARHHPTQGGGAQEEVKGEGAAEVISMVISESKHVLGPRRGGCTGMRRQKLKGPRETDPSRRRYTGTVTAPVPAAAPVPVPVPVLALYEIYTVLFSES